MSDRIPQAGAVAFRLGSAGPEVLLVRSTNGRHWIFPKGHLEPGESPESAALRELREEAGVVGGVVEKAGTLRFAAPAGAIEVEYFVVRSEEEGRPAEDRDRRWVGIEDAREMVSFADARELLESVAPVIRRCARSGDEP